MTQPSPLSRIDQSSLSAYHPTDLSCDLHHPQNTKITAIRYASHHDTTLQPNVVVLGQSAMKNTEIQCLCLQLASLREEAKHRLKNMRSESDDLKKQFNEFRKVTLGIIKQQQSQIKQDFVKVENAFRQKCEKVVQHYQSLISEKNRNHFEEINVMQRKYEQLLESKKQKKTMIEALMVKSKSKEVDIGQQATKNNAMIDGQNREIQQQNYKMIPFSKKQQCQSCIDNLQTQLTKVSKELSEKQAQLLTCTKELQSYRILLDQQRIEHVNALAKKSEQLLKAIQSASRMREQSVRNRNERRQVSIVKECQHQGLIVQLQRNIVLKDKQIQQLKHKIQQWQAYIGFDQSLSSHIQRIEGHCNSIKQKNTKFVNSLNNTQNPRHK